MSSDLIMTSFKLPAKVEEKMLHSIIKQGYGMRGKSKWIVEAIEAFLKISDYPELVEMADDMDNLVKPISLRLPRDLSIKVDDAVLEVRKVYPGMEGVRSNIIRASIMQKLI